MYFQKVAISVHPSLQQSDLCYPDPVRLGCPDRGADSPGCQVVQQSHGGDQQEAQPEQGAAHQQLEHGGHVRGNLYL